MKKTLKRRARMGVKENPYFQMYRRIGNVEFPILCSFKTILTEISWQTGGPPHTELMYLKLYPPGENWAPVASAPFLFVASKTPARKMHNRLSMW